jgi:hypothetical protein
MTPILRSCRVKHLGTLIVTLAKPNGLREAREVVSRLSGSDVNGCRVSIRLFGKPTHLSTTVPGTESTETSFENEDAAQCQSQTTRRSIRASTRNSFLSSSSEQLSVRTRRSQGSVIDRVEKEEKEESDLILAYQYDDSDIKTEVKVEPPQDDASKFQAAEEGQESPQADDHSSEERGTRDRATDDSQGEQVDAGPETWHRYIPELDEPL